MKKVIQYTLTLLLALLLFWVLFKDRDPAELWEKLKQTDLRWVALSIGISLLSHLHRGWRWVIALRPLGHKAPVFLAFMAVMVGYLANLALPRMGEVSRCAVFNRATGVPVSVAFGAVVAERVLDLILLLSFTALTVILGFDKIGNFLASFFGGQEGAYTKLSYALGGLVLLGVAGLVALYLLRDALKKLPFYEKIITFLGGIRSGLLSIMKLSPRDRMAYLFHTVMIWVGYFFMSYALFFSVPWTSGLGLEAGLVTLVMGGIGMAVPVQGGIGTYHLFVSRGLVPFGIAVQTGEDFAVLMHTSQVFMILVVGALSLLGLMLWKKATPPHDANT